MSIVLVMIPEYGFALRAVKILFLFIFVGDINPELLECQYFSSSGPYVTSGKLV